MYIINFFSISYIVYLLINYFKIFSSNATCRLSEEYFFGDVYGL